MFLALSRWLSWLEHPPVHQEGWGFNSQSVQIPMLQVWFPVRMHTRSNQLMFFSHISVCFFSLSPPLSPFLSLKINNHILELGFKKKKKVMMFSLESSSFWIKTKMLMLTVLEANGTDESITWFRLKIKLFIYTSYPGQKLHIKKKLRETFSITFCISWMYVVHICKFWGKLSSLL